MVLTDFVFALAKFAVYFFHLLFNCQVSIAPALRVSLSIISPSPRFVNRFFEIFSKIFDRFSGDFRCWFFAPTRIFYHRLSIMSIVF